MILLIGSTGNIGKYVKDYVIKHQLPFKEGLYQPKITNEHVVPFDFLDEHTYDKALEGITKVFFIRPPQIGDPKAIYPFLNACKDHQIKHIVFVSLMGVEKNPIPPHAKIEKYIKKIALPYTFIRPSFFMENLISPHGKDIKTLNQIIVPARKSKTSFIAAKDIGEACGVSLHESDKHINQAYTITGSDALDYDEVAAMFSNHLGRKITYANPNMNDYGKHMISLGYPKDYVSVTKMLYFMTRLGTAKKTTSTIETLLGRKATSFDTFIKENLNIWL